MSYVFGDDGSFSAAYPDGDPRVFVLQGLNQTISANDVAAAISNQTPTSIAGFAVLGIVTEPVLRDLAATVFSESSHVSTESEGIMRVIRNRSTLIGVTYDAPNFWSSHAQGGIGGEGILGRSTANYANANSLSVDQWGDPNMVVDRASTVRGMVTPADVTQGAYFWVATSGLQASGTIQDGFAQIPLFFWSPSPSERHRS